MMYTENYFSRFSKTIYSQSDVFLFADLEQDSFQVLKCPCELQDFFQQGSSFTDLFHHLIFSSGQDKPMSKAFQPFLKLGASTDMSIFRRIILHHEGYHICAQLSYYPNPDDQTAFLLLKIIPYSEKESQVQEKKSFALANVFLYSMVVDLDDDISSSIHPSEVVFSTQTQIQLPFSEWRNTLLEAFHDDDKAVFLKETDPSFISRVLQEHASYSFDIQMTDLWGEYIWVRHTMTRIADYRQNHLQFVYTVQNIEKEKRSLLQQIRQLEKENEAAGEALAPDDPHRPASAGSPDSTDNLQKKSTEQILSEIEEYIRRNYMKKITLKDLGTRFYINSAYLGQLLIRRLHVPFNEFLCQERLSHAAILLSHTEKPIQEIALDTGFTSLNYFARQFSEHYGCSPSKYRKKNRQS